MVKKHLPKILVGVAILFFVTFYYISTKIVFLNKLLFARADVAVTFSDSDNTATGFGGGTMDNIEWDVVNSWIEMDAAGLTEGSATFTSRIYDSAGTYSWQSIAWSPTGPYGKALPDSAATETLYIAGNATMADNTILWHMDESSGDVTNSADGSSNYTEGTSLRYGHTGLFGSAMYFSDDNSDIYGGQSQLYASANAKTLSVWFYTTSTPSTVTYAYTGDRLMGTDYETHGGRFYGLYLGVIGGQDKVWAYNWDGTEDKVGGAYTIGAWNHAVFVHDGATLSLYINGSLAGSTASGNTTNMSTYFYVGGQNYVGLMDEAAVFNRVLSAEEIQNLYYRGALDIDLQVRTCSLANCSDGTFVGLGGFTTTTFSEENAGLTTSTPQTSLSGLQNSQYIQYQVVMTTASSTVSPSMSSLTITGGTPTGVAITWDGDGGDSDWCTRNNWSGNVLPTSIDDVTIDTAVTVNTDSCADGDVDFSTLTIGGSAAATLELSKNIGTGGDVTIDNFGIFAQHTSSTQTITGTLTVKSGGILKSGDNSTSQAYEVDISAGAIDIQSGGSVDVDGLGYDSATGPGAPPSAIDSYLPGGGHAGDGGPGYNYLYGRGPAYCTVTDVATMGSGGGRGNNNTTPGGAGGGYIRLVASSTMTINGTITADGAETAAAYGSGGAGGGIYLTADSFVGTPISFTAIGAAGKSTGGDGSGGGGCVQLNYTTANAIAVSSITVAGGVTPSKGYRGGAGTVYISGPDSSFTIKNSGLHTYTGSTPITEDIVVDTLSLNYASTTLSHATSTSSFTISNGGTMIVSSSKRLSIPNGASATFSGAPTIYVQGTLDAPGISEIQGATIIVDSGGEYVGASSLGIGASSTFTLGYSSSTLSGVSTLVTSGTLNIYNGSVFGISSFLVHAGTVSLSGFTTSSPFAVTTFTVDGGTVTHAPNGETQTHTVSVSATTATIGSGGTVSADAKGYYGGDEAGTNGAHGDGPGGGLGTTSGGAGAGGAGKGKIERKKTTSRLRGGERYVILNDTYSVETCGGVM